MRGNVLGIVLAVALAGNCHSQSDELIRKSIESFCKATEVQLEGRVEIQRVTRANGKKSVSATAGSSLFVFSTDPFEIRGYGNPGRSRKYGEPAPPIKVSERQAVDRASKWLQRLSPSFRPDRPKVLKRGSPSQNLVYWVNFGEVVQGVGNQMIGNHAQFGIDATTGNLIEYAGVFSYRYEPKVINLTPDQAVEAASRFLATRDRSLLGKATATKPKWTHSFTGFATPEAKEAKEKRLIIFGYQVRFPKCFVVVHAGTGSIYGGAMAELKSSRQR